MTTDQNFKGDEKADDSEEVEDTEVEEDLPEYKMSEAMDRISDADDIQGMVDR